MFLFFGRWFSNYIRSLFEIITSDQIKFYIEQDDNIVVDSHT